MYPDKVLGVQYTIFILAGRVNNFGGIVLSLVSNRLAKSILNRRIVAIHKMPIDELDGKRGFS